MLRDLETRSLRSPLGLRRGLSLVVVPLTIVCCFVGRGSAQDAAPGPDRGGFTLLLSLGVGFQNDPALSESGTGLGGLNLGIGGFLTDNLALMFRASGTNVSYGDSSNSIRQVSGVGAASLQYWINDRFNVEGGFGVGFWDIEGTQEQGAGLMLGAGFAFFNRGRHNLQIGVEYAPAFTDPDTVQNIGIVFGYQLL